MKASIVFSRAWARAPRWAKAMGGSSSDGSRCCTTPDDGRTVDCGRVFNLSGSEIVVILLLALVVLGPEKLPDALRRAGRTYAELKKMGNSFQAEVKSALDEPMKEMRETADLLRKAADFSGETERLAGAAAPAAVPTADPDAAAARRRLRRRHAQPADEPALDERPRQPRRSSGGRRRPADGSR